MNGWRFFLVTWLINAIAGVSDTVLALRRILPSRSALLFFAVISYCVGICFLVVGFQYLRYRLSARGFILASVASAFVLSSTVWGLLSFSGTTVFAGFIIVAFGLTFIIYVCLECIEHLSTQALDT